MKAQPERQAEKPVTENAAKANVNPATSKTVVPTPAIQSIPAQTLKSSPLIENQVTPATVAVKPAPESPSSAGATLVAIPAIQLSADNGTQPAVAIPQNKTPEQVLGQAKAGEVVVTPNSVINPAPKVAGKQKN